MQSVEAVIFEQFLKGLKRIRKQATWTERMLFTCVALSRCISCTGALRGSGWWFRHVVHYRPQHCATNPRWLALLFRKRHLQCGARFGFQIQGVEQWHKIYLSPLIKAFADRICRAVARGMLIFKNSVGRENGMV